MIRLFRKSSEIFSLFLLFLLWIKSRLEYVGWCQKIPTDHKKEIYLNGNGKISSSKRERKNAPLNFWAIDPKIACEAVRVALSYEHSCCFHSTLMYDFLSLSPSPMPLCSVLAFFSKNHSHLIAIAKDVEECCRHRRRCPHSVSNKDTKKKKAVGRSFCGEKRDEVGAALMEMAKITKKMIWKRKIEEKFHDNEKRAKIKIEKMVGWI